MDPQSQSSEDQSRAWGSSTVFRPDPSLMTYYVLCAFLTLPGVVIMLPLLAARYATLRYRLDESGVWMRVGLLFRKESNLTYRRIQDVHVTRNLFQRWLGISTISVQTASGSSQAEVTVEGVRDADALRDFLYERMRGAKDHSLEVSDAGVERDEILEALRDIRNSLRTLVEGREPKP